MPQRIRTTKARNPGSKYSYPVLRGISETPGSPRKRPSVPSGHGMWDATAANANPSLALRAMCVIGEWRPVWGCGRGTGGVYRGRLSACGDRVVGEWWGAVR